MICLCNFLDLNRFVFPVFPSPVYDNFIQKAKTKKEKSIFMVRGTNFGFVLRCLSAKIECVDRHMFT